jgi:hypothetical protein
MNKCGNKCVWVVDNGVDLEEAAEDSIMVFPICPYIWWVNIQIVATEFIIYGVFFWKIKKIKSDLKN